MTTVSVQVRGNEVVARELFFVGDAAVNLRPVWEEVAEYLQDATREQFATEGGRGGDPWAPLNNKYAFSKWRRGESLEMLRATDAMYDELTGKGNSNTAFQFFDEYMTFGSDTPQFAYQQGNEGLGDMPIRLPIQLTEADSRVITGMIMDRIISGAGFYADLKVSPKTGKKYYANRGANGRFAARG